MFLVFDCEGFFNGKDGIDGFFGVFFFVFFICDCGGSCLVVGLGFCWLFVCVIVFLFLFCLLWLDCMKGFRVGKWMLVYFKSDINLSV